MRAVVLCYLFVCDSAHSTVNASHFDYWQKMLGKRRMLKRYWCIYAVPTASNNTHTKKGETKARTRKMPFQSVYGWKENGTEFEGMPFLCAVRFMCKNCHSWQSHIVQRIVHSIQYIVHIFPSQANFPTMMDTIKRAQNTQHFLHCSRYTIRCVCVCISQSSMIRQPYRPPTEWLLVHSPHQYHMREWHRNEWTGKRTHSMNHQYALKKWKKLRSKHNNTSTTFFCLFFWLFVSKLKANGRIGWATVRLETGDSANVF